MNVSVVIPTYNERENVKVLIPQIFNVLEKKGVNGKVIVVDDNSPDGTALEIGLLSADYDLLLISRPKKAGLGSAYIIGFKEALNYSDVIFEMDADMSHNPECLSNFLDELAFCDVVIGSRYIPGGRIEHWGIYRKLVSAGGNLLARKMMRIDVHDITTGYRAYKKEVLCVIDLDSVKSNGYAFQAEILHKISEKNYRIHEVPITFRDRKTGESKLSKREIISFFVLCFKIFFRDRARI
jgi:dolichol-phosphate mannosyltransferase